MFHRLGVRIIQLTYNDRNLVGDGCLEPGNAGLSAFGRQVVERMNALGIAVDLSHCGTRTTADGIAASSQAAADHAQRLPRGLPSSAQQGRSRAESDG